MTIRIHSFLLLSMLLSFLFIGCNENDSNNNSAAVTQSAPMIIAGDNGAMFYSMDDGADWSRIHLNTTQSIKKVVLMNTPPFRVENKFVAVSDSNIYLSVAGSNGLMWTKATIESPVCIAKSVSFTNITFVDEITGYALGWDSATSQVIVLKSIDGGVTWKDFHLTQPIKTKMCAIAHFDSILVVGGAHAMYSRININSNTNVVYTIPNAIGDINYINYSSRRSGFSFMGNLEPNNPMLPVSDSLRLYFNYLSTPQVLSKDNFVLHDGRLNHNAIPRYFIGILYGSTSGYFYQKGIKETFYSSVGTNGIWIIKKQNNTLPFPKITKVNYPGISTNDTIRTTLFYENPVTNEIEIYAGGSKGLLLLTKDFGTTVQKITSLNMNSNINTMAKGNSKLY